MERKSPRPTRPTIEKRGLWPGHAFGWQCDGADQRNEKGEGPADAMDHVAPQYGGARRAGPRRRVAGPVHARHAHPLRRPGQRHRRDGRAQRPYRGSTYRPADRPWPQSPADLRGLRGEARLRGRVCAPRKLGAYCAEQTRPGTDDTALSMDREFPQPAYARDWPRYKTARHCTRELAEQLTALEPQLASVTGRDLSTHRLHDAA